MRKFSIILLSAAVALVCGCREEVGPRVVEDFNFEWRFNLGDSKQWSATDYDDSEWRSLHLPHDWSVEGDFSEYNPSTPSGGALPGGIGWYRKHFKTPEGVSQGRRVSVEFDGVFMNSTVYINGHALGTRPYGYSSFTYELTPYLNGDGEDNLIAVRCDNAEQPNSRWYAGCGIYRNVRLVTTGATRVAWSGTYVTVSDISKANATASVEVTLDGTIPEGATVRNTILNDKGSVVVRGDEVPAARVLYDTLTIVKPHFWDIEDTFLYTLETEVSVDGVLSDTYETHFGVRTAEFDVDHGFFLNGRHVELQGVCLHHDMGCLGTAVHFRALQRELEILKGCGVNAIRTSHNPPAPELLQLADEMGFLIIDEAFDMWRKRKTQYDYARFFDDWYERDLTDFIRRDRNHPSIIMWSIGNELSEQRDSREDRLENLTPAQANLLLNFMESFTEYSEGDTSPNIVLAKHVAALVKSLDTTRPITAGCNQPFPNNNLYKSGAMEVFGINYHTANYDEVREWCPELSIYGSETSSSLNSRGVYPQPSTDTLIVPRQWWMTYDTPDHQCTAYDACRASWADLHEEAWVRIREREWMAGTFVWTGFDYLGEPTPYGWPSRSSYFGICDLAGFPKDIYWMYKSEWTDETTLHLLPHWNWAQGDSVDVWAYYNHADEVELFVNGRSVGRDRKEGEKLHAQWDKVPFQPGRLEVVSYQNGRVVARDAIQTTSKPVKLKLTADRGTIDADGYDLSYITIEALDASGREVPNADCMLHFSVTGAGELVGVDNGNAADTMCLKGDRKAMFSGKALAVVRSFKGIPGSIRLTVESDLGTQHIDIKVK